MAARLKWLDAHRGCLLEYWTFGLRRNSQRKGKSIRVHRLIAATFIPNPENKPLVNHIDGNGLNNRVENLEWATSAENNQHAHNMGLMTMSSGEDHYLSKLTHKAVEDIRRNCIKGDPNYSCASFARKYDVHPSTVRRIVNGNHYLDNEYVPPPKSSVNERKLTAEQVIWIRAHYVSRDPVYGQKALARRFGVTQTAIGCIVRGRTYRDV